MLGNGFSIKSLKVKLLAGEQKATESDSLRAGPAASGSAPWCRPDIFVGDADWSSRWLETFKGSARV